MKVFDWNEGQQSPTWGLWWEDSAGALVNLTGKTFQLTIGLPGQANVLQTTTGMTGAVGSGSEPTGVPNLVVDPNATQIDLLTVPAGTEVLYRVWVRDTTDGRDYPADLGLRLHKRST